ncbi:MAG: DUF6153 family protein [Nocardioides sp.]
MSRTPWAPAALLLVLAGLFGMHGLGGHAAHDGASMSSMSSMTSMTSMSVAVPAASGVPHPDGPSLGPASDAGDLCVAVLAGGLLLLLLAAGSRRTPWLLPRGLVAVVPPARARDPDPPTPQLLSVFRC